MKLLLPNTHVDVFDMGLPVFFLAGPILGADDWQTEASHRLTAMCPDGCIIVNPRRYEPTHPIRQFRLPGNEKDFANQTAWERYYLSLAGLGAERGCIVFWLPRESTVTPRTDGQPYACDTRGELGEWRGRAIYTRCRMVVGAEAGFPGLKVITRNFEEALDANYEISPSLETTLLRAIAFT